MLPKLADIGPAKAPIRADARRRSWEKMREVFFEVSLDAGASADEAMKALEFIRHELKIRRARKRQKLLQKSHHTGRPKSAMRATAGLWGKGVAASEPGKTELVEAGFCDAELLASRRGIKRTVVKSR